MVPQKQGNARSHRVGPSAHSDPHFMLPKIGPGGPDRSVLGAPGARSMSVGMDRHEPTSLAIIRWHRPALPPTISGSVRSALAAAL
ncbi:MAG TPA: hypothetical protein VKZ53_00955 [Candidatus Angelobacter sp.]|nr:hypothetical protein [Candidatus Angelobacter sp.]